MATRRSIPAVILLALIMVWLVMGSAIAAPVEGIIIDHFDESDSVIVIVPDTGGESFESSSSVIGGERDILVSNVTGGAEGEVVVETNPGGNSLLSVSYGATVNANVQIQWDGVDGDSAIDPSGLGGLDLTQSGLDRFLLGISSTDLPFTLTMQVYQDSSCSESNVAIPGLVSIYEPTVVEIPFTSFNACAASTPASFSNVGAIVLNIDGVVNMDFQLHFIQLVTDTYLDFGDAPDSNYFTLLSSNGARHSLTDDIYLGASVTAEADGTDSSTASAHADDDGVTPFGNWSDGDGDVEVSVAGIEHGCLSIWVDTSAGGFATNFNEGNLVLDRQSVSAGNFSLKFSLDPGVANNGQVYARFRIVPDILADGCVDDPPTPPAGLVFGGEVEDYLWSFSPTAIELQSINARSNPSNKSALAIVGLVALLLAMLTFFNAFRSHRT